MSASLTVTLMAKRTRKPPTAPFVPPKSFYEDDWLELLLHFHRELTRLEIDEEKLTPYQRQTLSDLESPLHEQNLAHMLQFWMLDLAQERVLQQHFKPRIELTVGLTSKKNLYVTWEPAGLVDGRPGPNSDWRAWYVVQYPTYRPSNELLFVREIGFLLNTYKFHQSPIPQIRGKDLTTEEWLETHRARNWRNEYRRRQRDIDSVLLTLGSAAVTLLKRRLQHRFEVSMITEIECTLEPVPKLGDYAARVSRWEIVNVADRLRAAEEKELGELPAILECPLDAFVSALLNAHGKGATGPAPNKPSAELLSRRLKKAGYSKMSVGKVARFKYLVEKLRPEVFASIKPSNIVRFPSPE